MTHAPFLLFASRQKRAITFQGECQHDWLYFGLNVSLLKKRCGRIANETTLIKRPNDTEIKKAMGTAFNNEQTKDIILFVTMFPFQFDYIQCLTPYWLLYTSFWHFYLFCLFVLFSSRIGDNIMEFDATVIQVRGLASYKTRFNPRFSTLENACTKSGIWQLLSIRLMCLNFWFCHLIGDFPFGIFLGVQYFCDFTFYFFSTCYISYKSRKSNSFNLFIYSETDEKAQNYWHMCCLLYNLNFSVLVLLLNMLRIYIFFS